MFQEWAGDYDYILAFPTAGGQHAGGPFDGVLFDHLMLEGEQKVHISNYSDLTTYWLLQIWSGSASWYGRVDLDSYGDYRGASDSCSLGIWKIQKN